MGQITQAKTRITQADTEEEQLRTKLAMKQKEADELQKRWAAEERSAGDGKKKVEFLKKELANLQENLSRCGWTNEQEESLVEQIRNLRLEVRNFAEVTILSFRWPTRSFFTQQRDRERSSISSLDFNYTAPHNFDRGKVKGTVGSLVSLDEGNYDKAAALEAAAGGKLYQVIIEDERVGKTLLNKELCQLPRRVTFIPLNKVDSKTASQVSSRILSFLNVSLADCNTERASRSSRDRRQRAPCVVHGWLSRRALQRYGICVWQHVHLRRR